jgi:hypothetical protein
MKTSSLWGAPPTRYYSFLKRVEQHFHSQPINVAILGCSDGKFVVPAARRGHTIFAIDVDEVALFGGVKEGPQGRVHMPGLVTRLEAEGLLDRVQVVYGDFVSHRPVVPSEAVFTSGALQYSRNLIHTMDQMVQSVQLYIKPEGYLYVDYMLPLEEKYEGRNNYPGRATWSSYFSDDQWQVLYNRVLPPVFESAHVDNPLDHYHHWGHLLVHRLR